MPNVRLNENILCDFYLVAKRIAKAKYRIPYRISP